MPSRAMLPDRADVVDVGETVVDGRIVVGAGTPVASGIALRIVQRAGDEVVYDDAGEVVAVADAITGHPLELGQALDVTVGAYAGERWIVSGRVNPLRGRTLSGFSAPIRHA